MLTLFLYFFFYYFLKILYELINFFTENSLDAAESALKQVDLDGKIKSLTEAKNNHQR